MMSSRVLLAATFLAATAACAGEQEALSTPPSNPVITVRLIGPDGDSYIPKDVHLFHLNAGGEHWPMRVWADGTCTDLGAPPLVPGQMYDLMTDSWGRGGVFAYTRLRFTALSESIDLGNFDVSLRGLSMTSPADGTVATSYPMEFKWTAYANPAATYEPKICAERLGNGCVFHSGTHALGYQLTAEEKAQSITGRAGEWQMIVSFTTPEGYDVMNQTETVPFTFPN